MDAIGLEAAFVAGPPKESLGANMLLHLQRKALVVDGDHLDSSIAASAALRGPSFLQARPYANLQGKGPGDDPELPVLVGCDPLAEAVAALKARFHNEVSEALRARVTPVHACMCRLCRLCRLSARIFLCCLLLTVPCVECALLSLLVLLLFLLVSHHPCLSAWLPVSLYLQALFFVDAMEPTFIAVVFRPSYVPLSPYQPLTLLILTVALHIPGL